MISQNSRIGGNGEEEGLYFTKQALKIGKRRFKKRRDKYASFVEEIQEQHKQVI